MLILLSFSPFSPGKVNQFSTNSRHFPAGNIDSTAILLFFSRESEPLCRESVALSPTTFQYNRHRCHPISLIRRESEPNCHESRALSPETKFDNRFYGHSACIPHPPNSAASAVRPPSLRRPRYQDRTRPTQEKTEPQQGRYGENLLFYL